MTDLQHPTGPRALVAGKASLTNARLAAAFRASGLDAAVVAPGELPELAPGDLVLARLDVLASLDGVEDGGPALAAVERAGAVLLNRPAALLGAHDKLATALLLARDGVPHPRTALVRAAEPPIPFEPPYVLKPRFGSWGRDVFLCRTRRCLAACLDRVAGRGWFRRQGALVQELVRPVGRDLRVVVAGGEVVGAVERVARPGEWRTNVALGAARRRVEPGTEARSVALAAAAALGVDLAGVDLLVRGDGSPVVLEVNGAVDFTPEYGLAGADPFAAAAAALAGVLAPAAVALAR